MTAININDLTIGQAKELAAQLQAFTPPKAPSGSRFIGEKVIIRTLNAGVHYGKLIEKSGDEVILENSRRLWQWKTKTGFTLSGLSQHGLDAAGCKFANVVPLLWLQAIEIIPCSEIAIAEIESQPEHNA